MKILIVMDPGILVPPQGYGGIERLVETFAKEYAAMGNEVHLLVTTGSGVEGCTIHPYGKQGFPPTKADAFKAMPVAWKFLWEHRNNFDLIHNFGRLAYLLPVLNHPVKKIMTYQREISARNIQLINRLKNKNMFFTACSADLLSRLKASGNWKVVYNAIAFTKYTLQPVISNDAPLMFLGRIERVKGCHIAIKLAKKTGDNLIIAGNISPLPEEIIYFEQEIKPHIDGVQIIFTGALNDEQKNIYLRNAKAFIFPIEWNEPFGIVMIEAMACGTPVIGFNKGSVDEVIDEGITGFKVNDFEGMLLAVKKCITIDRKRCREQAIKRFNAPVVAKQYLDMVCKAHKTIVIITTGQPAANPRVVKEYEAFIQEGYLVKVLYTYSLSWSYNIDEEKFRLGKIKRPDFILVGGNPYNKKVAYFLSRLFFKIFGIIAKVIPSGYLKEITFARSAFYLWLNAKKYTADVYIAHYIGALPAAIRAASKHKAAVVFDAEDFHRGEDPYYPAQLSDVIDIENRLLPKINLLTTASPLISKMYEQLYPSKKVVTINNVFSLRYLQPAMDNPTLSLKLFWFSQNIGPNRGLEVIVDAFNKTNDGVTLTLLGNIRNKDYVEELLKKVSKPEKINFISPVNPEEIFKIAGTFDIGLAAETPYCQNRDICLTNKLFTYLIAGNCILASDTSAQKKFMQTYNSIGSLYKHDDPNDLAMLINHYDKERPLLLNCKKNALKLASDRLNWELESEKLISVIATL
jgi:glycosyltransferase involved in cell wall biosynthesis